MINTRLFEAKEYKLVVYNGQAIVNRAFRFFTVVSCDAIAYEEIDFDFPDYASAYFRVFNEREGRKILDVPLDRDGEYLIANISALDMTFDSLGEYYYEVGYVRSVYEQALRYGPLRVI